MADDPQVESQKIVVEVVDRFSKPLNDLKRQLEGFSNVSEGVGKVTKQMDVLRDSVSGLGKILDVVNPKLAEVGRISLGVTAGVAGIAAAVAGVIAATKDFAGTTVELSYLNKETGLSIDLMRGLQAAAARVGVPVASMQRGFSEFANQATLARIGQGELYKLIANSDKETGDNLALRLRSAKTVEEALRIYAEALDKESGDRAEQHKRALTAAAGFDPNLARLTGEELLKYADEFIKKWGETTKPQIEAAQKFHDSMVEITESLTELGNALATGGTLEALNNVIKGLADSMAKPEFRKALENVGADTLAIANSLREALGYAKAIALMLIGSNEIRGILSGENLPFTLTPEGGLKALQERQGNEPSSGLWRGFRFFLDPKSQGGESDEEKKKPLKEGSLEGTKGGIISGFETVALMMHNARLNRGDGPSGVERAAYHPGGGVGSAGTDTGDRGTSTGASGAIRGTVDVGGQTFHYGSGGRGRGAIPFGDFPINIGKGDIGPIGKGLGSVGTVGGLGGVIDDPRYPGRPRAGIQIHANSGDALDRLYSQGCFTIPRSEWPRFKAALLDQAAKNPEGLMLHVGPDGLARVYSRADARKRLATGATAAEGEKTTIEGQAELAIRLYGYPPGMQYGEDNKSAGRIFSPVNPKRGDSAPVASESE